MKAVHTYLVIIIFSLLPSELIFSQEFKSFEIGKNDCSRCLPEFLFNDSEYFYVELNDIIYKYDQEFKKVSETAVNWKKIASSKYSMKKSYLIKKNVLTGNNIISFYNIWDKKLMKHKCVAFVLDRKGQLIKTKQLFTLNKNSKEVLYWKNWGGIIQGYNNSCYREKDYISSENNKFIALLNNNKVYLFNEGLDELKVIEKPIKKIEDWKITKSGTLILLYTTASRRTMLLTYSPDKDKLKVEEQDYYPEYTTRRYIDIDNENDQFYVISIIGKKYSIKKKNYPKSFMGRKFQLKIYNSSNSELVKSIEHKVDDSFFMESKKQKYQGIYQMDFVKVQKISDDYFIIFEQNDLIRKVVQQEYFGPATYIIFDRNDVISKSNPQGVYEETARSTNIIVYKIENLEVSSNKTIARYTHGHTGNLFNLSSYSTTYNNKLVLLYNTSDENSGDYVDPIRNFNICGLENDLNYNCKDYLLSETINANPVITKINRIFNDKLICFTLGKKSGSFLKIVSFFIINPEDLQ